ncbi:hypothetical protein BC831DRAFT_476530 [Entophlyctis helioformis]|nr:hypothetical protein BC831DRAFT_476530 [Entophlyctis helioformis]
MSVSIQLVEGVTGGFVPARPRRFVTIDMNGGKATITKALKSTAPTAVEGFEQFASKPDLAVEQVRSLIDETLATFQSLPHENPIGGEDVYGYDVSIHIQSKSFNWQNTPNSGCNIHPSTVRPTDQQREIFKAFVDRINKLADDHASTPVAE